MAESKNTITFRGKKVALHYPLLAISKLQKEQGISLADMEDMGDQLDIDTLGKLVWAGLCVQFPDATVDEVLGSFEISDLQGLSEALTAAFSAMSK